jgi:pimeloyl-ACP methyl ester carboxylesterase
MPNALSSGVKIHYEVEGEGPFVILQTGAAGDSRMWKQAGYLKGLSSFTSILVDHRGHGRSDRPLEIDRHRMEYYVSDILAVMDSVHIDKAAFIGYSDGGRVGFELAISHPDRITRLVSLGSVGIMNEEESQGREELAASIRANGVGQLISYFEEAEGIRFPDWLYDQFLRTDGEMFALELIAWKSWTDA